MRSIPSIFALLLCCILPGSVTGNPAHALRIPNGNSVPHPDVPGSPCPGVGHESCSGGGARNAFGRAFEESGLIWADVCREDSDNDGHTNGEELGDPCCVWKEGDAPLRTTDISHPGFPNSFPDNAVTCDMGLGNSTKYPFYNQGETQLSQTMTMSYTVPDVVTDYVNFPFNFEVDGSPASKTLYLVGWEVDIQHYEHVHHFVGYFCPTEHASFDSWSNEQDPGRRYQKGCETQAIAWAPGSGRVAFPGDVTLPIGPGTTHASIIIEVHYDNPDLVSGVFDTSSLKLKFTDQPRVHDAAFLSMGDVLLSFNNVIPAGKDSWAVTSRCLITTKDSQPISAFAHVPHMHWNGIRLWSEKIASGGAPTGSNGEWKFEIESSPADSGPLSTAGRIDTYDADLQVFYDYSDRDARVLQLNHGDLMSTTCVYNTADKTKDVKGGLASQDEMCIHYFFYYPADALDREGCNAADPSIAGDWPKELYSVQQIPELLSKLLTPNSELRVGFDTTSGIAGDDDGDDEDGEDCDMIFTVMNLCGITDMEESSQWTENPLMCDESTECYSSMTAACKPLRDAHNDICSGCPLPSDMDCAWAEIMQACDVTDLEDESQWNLDKICNKGGACYPTFGTCGYMRTIQIEECGEEQCTWSGGQSEGTAPVSLQSTDQVKSIYATTVFPDLSMTDFSSALENLFKLRIADAAGGIPTDHVRVLQVKAGSVAVDWAAVLPASDTDVFEAFEAALLTTPEIVFIDADFGSSIEMTVTAKKSENFKAFMDATATDGDSSDAERQVSAAIGGLCIGAFMAIAPYFIPLY